MFDVVDVLSCETVYSGGLKQCETESCNRGGYSKGYVVLPHGEKPTVTTPSQPVVKREAPPTVIQERDPKELELF